MADSERRRSSPEGTIPAPPEGYARPHRLDQSWVVFSVAGTLLALAALYVGLSVHSSVGRSPRPLDTAAAMLVFVGGIVATILLHELVHGLAYRYYGYDVSYSADILRATFTTAARGQLHTRAQAIRIALAPLCILTPIAVALVAVPSTVVSLVGLVMFVLNTSGSVADVVLAVRLLSIPEQSLCCDADSTYIYEPLDARENHNSPGR